MSFYDYFFKELSGLFQELFNVTTLYEYYGSIMLAVKDGTYTIINSDTQLHIKRQLIEVIPNDIGYLCLIRSVGVNYYEIFQVTDTRLTRVCIKNVIGMFKYGNKVLVATINSGVTMLYSNGKFCNTGLDKYITGGKLRGNVAIAKNAFIQTIERDKKFRVEEMITGTEQVCEIDLPSNSRVNVCSTLVSNGNVLFVTRELPGKDWMWENKIEPTRCYHFRNGLLIHIITDNIIPLRFMGDFLVHTRGILGLTKTFSKYVKSCIADGKNIYYISGGVKKYTVKDGETDIYDHCDSIIQFTESIISAEKMLHHLAILSH